jgi:hypothetical protein
MPPKVTPDLTFRTVIGRITQCALHADEDIRFEVLSGANKSLAA